MHESRKHLFLCLTLQILVIFIPSSRAGIASDLPEDQVEDVLALYRKHCRASNAGGGYGDEGYSTTLGSSSSGSQQGGYGYGPPASQGPKINIICKEGREIFEPPSKKVIRIPTQKPRKNILFVEAPKIKYHHQIDFVANDIQAPRTIIYVLPQKATHQLQVSDQRNPSQQGVKPQVFFLKGDRPPTQPIGAPVSPPRPEYGVPVHTTERPSSSYGPPSLLPPQEPPRPVYGTPVQVTTSRPPVIAYGPPSEGGYSAPVAPLQKEFHPNVPFNPANLGPEYEIVPADADTLAKYQNLFSRQQYDFASSGTRQSRDNSKNNDNDKRDVVDLGYVNGGSKVIFPSESIHNYHVQDADGREQKSYVHSKEQDDEDETLRSVIDRYEKSQVEENSPPAVNDNGQQEISQVSTEATPSSTTSESTSTSTESKTSSPPSTTMATTVESSTEASEETPSPLSTEAASPFNLFDDGFIRQLIAKAKNASSSGILSEGIPPLRTIYRLGNADDVRDISRLKYMTAPPTSSVDGEEYDSPAFPLPYQLSSSPINVAQRRSMQVPNSFEFIPANLVSYSYSKVGQEGN